MSDPVASAFSEHPLVVTAVQTPPPGKSVTQWLGIGMAWVVIVALTVLVALNQFLAENRREQAGKDTLGLINMQMQGRYLVGTKLVVAEFGGRQTTTEEMQQAKLLNTGTVDQRLRYLVLVGELSGPRKALTEIDALEKKLEERQIEVTDQQAKILDILRRLYGDYEKLRLTAPAVKPDERELLRSELDWFGDLALAPAGLPPHTQQVALGLAGGPAAVVVAQAQTPKPKSRSATLEPATRTTVSLLVVFLLLLFAGFAGFVLLMVVGIQWLRGKIPGGLFVNPHRGSIYAETFALWMLLFVGVSWAMSFVPASGRMAAAVVGPLLSLGALAWPRMRGVPWPHLLHDIGLTPGRQPALEPVYGIVCYLMMLPVLAQVLIVMVLGMGVVRLLEGGGPPEDFFGPSGGASHPAVEMIVQGNVGQRLLLVLLGAVMAPIIEEIMFRGVLYRHLRDLTGRWHAVVSVLVSATLMGFIFAVIHPQGLVGVPGIMMLSFTFTLAREWRGTLIPGMVAHALNNGAIFVLVMLMLGN